MKYLIALLLSACAAQKPLLSPVSAHLNCYGKDIKTPWLSLVAKPDSIVQNSNFIEVKDGFGRTVMKASGNCVLRYWHEDELAILKSQMERVESEKNTKEEKKKRK